jgi:hypothetical protein
MPDVNGENDEIFGLYVAPGDRRDDSVLFLISTT